MTLIKLANMVERGSAEESLRVRVTTVSNVVIADCAFGALADEISKSNHSDFYIVDMNRVDLVPEDKKLPTWNKSLLIHVV